jgi:hypothetical protein
MIPALLVCISVFNLRSHKASVAHACNPSAWEAEIGKIMVWFEDSLGKLFSRAQWTGGVAQVVEYMLCKCEVLAETPLSPKKNRVSLTYLSWPQTCDPPVS